MENISELLNTPVGNIERLILKPAKVKIVSVEISEVKSKKPNAPSAQKVVCTCKHPDSPNTIKLSSVQFIEGKAVSVSGLWVNRDTEGKLQKGSALVRLLEFLGASTIAQLAGKDCNTELDNNYLCLKIY